MVAQNVGRSDGGEAMLILRRLRHHMCAGIVGYCGELGQKQVVHDLEIVSVCRRCSARIDQTLMGDCRIDNLGIAEERRELERGLRYCWG